MSGIQNTTGKKCDFEFELELKLIYKIRQLFKNKTLSDRSIEGLCQTHDVEKKYMKVTIYFYKVHRFRKKLK